MRRSLAALTSLALAVSLAACQDGGVPVAACSDDAARSAGAPGDAEPMLVLGDAEYSPTIVYADGAVVVPDDTPDGAASAVGHLTVPMMAPGYHGAQPGGFLAGSLSDCELGLVIDAADDLFTDGVDFGSPGITDQGGAEVSYRGRTGSVYAFSRSDPTEHGDLSRSQNAARRDLADLWALVQGSAELGGEVEPDRLFVHTYGAVADDELVDWPLDVPLSELAAPGCTTVVQPDHVEALLDRLAADEPLLDDGDWRLAVMIAAPGVPDC